MIWFFLATSGGLGYLPKAPGTWGSLSGFPLAFLLQGLSWPLQGLAWGLLIPFAIFVIYKTEALGWGHDDKRVVIDETLGQALALSFVPMTWHFWLLGFVLFRCLDIWKPWLIRRVDRSIKSPWGTLLDDLLAGGVACIILHGIVFFSAGF